jgi:hypothetical protein
MLCFRNSPRKNVLEWILIFQSIPPFIPICKLGAKNQCFLKSHIREWGLSFMQCCQVLVIKCYMISNKISAQTLNQAGSLATQCASVYHNQLGPPVNMWTTSREDQEYVLSVNWGEISSSSGKCVSESHSNISSVMSCSVSFQLLAIQMHPEARQLTTEQNQQWMKDL